MEVKGRVVTLIRVNSLCSDILDTVQHINELGRRRAFIIEERVKRSPGSGQLELAAAAAFTASRFQRCEPRCWLKSVCGESQVGRQRASEMNHTVSHITQRVSQ